MKNQGGEIRGWTAKRRAALVLSILRGEISIQEAWAYSSRGRRAENALRSKDVRRAMEEVTKGSQIFCEFG